MPRVELYIPNMLELFELVQATKQDSPAEDVRDFILAAYVDMQVSAARNPAERRYLTHIDAFDAVGDRA